MEFSSPSVSPDASSGEGRDATFISVRAADGVGRPATMAELGRSMEGRALGPYRLLEFVGGGGMGVVFRALDSTLDRIVAVKVLSRQQSSDQEMLKRFRNEAQSAARLDHENIGRVHAVGSDDGWHYIVFEYIEGTNLRDVIARSGPFDLSRTIDVTVQLADALEHASQRDVVHRDIKPSNIIITPTGRARIVDMGLARLHQVADDNDLTASGMTLGTFDYISPEQARDPREADVRSDLYSLGCTIFFMLAGRPPFADGTMVQKLLQHQQDEPPAIETLRPDIPRQFGEIIRRLMRKDPRERYQRPAELVADVLECADDLGIELSGPRPTVAPLPGPQRYRVRNHLPWLVPVALFAATVFMLRIWPPGGDSGDEKSTVPSSTLLSDGSAPYGLWRVMDTPESDMQKASLAEAIQSASDGDHIELAYSGVHDEPPFVLVGKRLTIRAAEGWRPGIRFTGGLPVTTDSSSGQSPDAPTVREAACFLDSSVLRLDGVFVLVTTPPRGATKATSLFVLKGASRLECSNGRLQMLRGFDVGSGDSILRDGFEEDAFVEVMTSADGEKQTEASEIRIVASTVEGEANFLEVSSAVTIDIAWSNSTLTDALRFAAVKGSESGAGVEPEIKARLSGSQFECNEAFASLRDSVSGPLLPVLVIVAEASRFRIPNGGALLEQSGVSDPEAYRAAIDWFDRGSQYQGSPIFRRIDGAAERIEIDYASAAQDMDYRAAGGE
jgi:serine/threonine protein kinase